MFRRVGEVVGLLAVVGVCWLMAVPAAYAGDSPDGFFWGTDDNGPAPSSSASPCPSSAVPWKEPNTQNGGCGNYGFYAGNVASFENISCGFGTNGWNSSGATHANGNVGNSPSYGVGPFPVYYGGGPGSDPNYDGTASEATAWGKRQADAASSAAASSSISWPGNILVFDVEEGQGYEGWTEVDVPHSGCAVDHSHTDNALNRDTFNGFWDELENHTPWRPAVYAGKGTWDQIMGSSGTLGNTLEIGADWGSNPGCINPAPIGWNQTCGTFSNGATFFGGTTRADSCAMAWQWDGRNGDYDQVDTNRVNNGLCEY